MRPSPERGTRARERLGSVDPTMSWYALELVELAPDHDAAEIAGALGIDPRALRSLALPATVREGLAEADAELLFHHLHRAGATLRLRPVARSSAPAPASELPLPDLPLPEPPAGSSARALSSIESITASGSRPGVIPASPAQREVTGSFSGALLSAAVYPVSSGGTVAMMIGVGALATVAFFIGLRLSLTVAWLPMGAGLCILAAYFCAVIRHGSYGHDGAAVRREASGDELWDVIMAGLRVAVALYFIPLVSMGLALVYSDRSAISVIESPPIWVHLANAVHTLLLPASLMLAASTTGCLGGLNYPAAVQVVTRVPLGYLGLYAALVPGWVLVWVGVVVGGALALQGLSIGLALLTSVLTVTLALTYVGRALGTFMWFYGNETGL